MSLRVTVGDIDEIDDSNLNSMNIIYLKRAGRIVGSFKPSIGAIDTCDGARDCKCTDWRGMLLFHGVTATDLPKYDPGKTTLGQMMAMKKASKVSCKECHVQNAPRHALDCLVMVPAGQQFNVLPSGHTKAEDVKKDDGKTRSEPVLPNIWGSSPAEPECICEVTAFGVVVNEKCPYPHK